MLRINNKDLKLFWPYTLLIINTKFMKNLKLVVLSLSFNSYILNAQYITPSGINYKDGKSLYYFGTAVFTTINVATTYFNVKKLHKYDKYRSNALFGALSGSTQTALGLVELKKSNHDTFVPAAINVGLGLTTFVSSIIRLATKNPKQDNNFSINIFYVPRTSIYNSVTSVSFKKQMK